MKHPGFLCVMILVGCQSAETAQPSTNTSDDAETITQPSDSVEDESEKSDEEQKTESNSNFTRKN